MDDQYGDVGTPAVPESPSNHSDDAARNAGRHRTEGGSAWDRAFDGPPINPNSEFIYQGR